MSALRANQALRLGLRAASRNPELSFGKALIDIAGTALSLAPVVLAGLLLGGALEEGDLEAVLASVARLTWPLAGALLTAALLSFTAGAAFWAGAVPVLAADAELGERPPRGAFVALLSRGFARVLRTSLLALSLELLFSVGASAAIVAGAALFARRPTPALAAAAAFAITVAIAGGLLVDQLARLSIARAATLGEGAVAAISGAASLLGRRLGAVALIAVAFALLQLVVSTAGATVAGSVSAMVMFDPDGQLLALAPRIALFVAMAAVLAWLEVARTGALGILAANDAGLLDPPEPQERRPAPATLERPREERVIEALPAPEERVIEALPAPEEPVIEALPAEEPVIEALPAPQVPPGEAQPAPGQPPKKPGDPEQH